MSRLMMHVDGSRVMQRPLGLQSLGWAVVACYNDQLLEERGAYQCPLNGPATGYHEHVAFVHGVLLAHRLGVAFENVTLVCDDDVLGYAQTWLHDGNYLGKRREQVLQRLSQTTRMFFDSSVEQLVLTALDSARVVKVKGHQLHAYQERADYLAKASAWASVGEPASPVLDFESWLANGIEHYSRDADEVQKWYAPFSGAP